MLMTDSPTGKMMIPVLQTMKNWQNITNQCCHWQNDLRNGKVDQELTQQVRQIEHFWQSVLQRLLRLMTFLCQRGLAELMVRPLALSG